MPFTPCPRSSSDGKADPSGNTTSCQSEVPLAIASVELSPLQRQFSFRGGFPSSRLMHSASSTGSLTDCEVAANALIALRDVQLTPILSDVHAVIPRGMVTVVFGPSGSGVRDCMSGARLLGIF